MKICWRCIMFWAFVFVIVIYKIFFLDEDMNFVGKEDKNLEILGEKDVSEVDNSRKTLGMKIYDNSSEDQIILNTDAILRAELVNNVMTKLGTEIETELIEMNNLSIFCNGDIYIIKKKVAKDYELLDVNFKVKYYLNGFLVNDVIEQLKKNVPIGGYYKDYMRDHDTEMVLGNENTKRIMMDLQVNKETAELYNLFIGLKDHDQKLLPLIPTNSITKPIEIILAEITKNTEKLVAKRISVELKNIQKLVLDNKKLGLSEDQAIKSANEAYQDQLKYNNGYGQFNSLLKWFIKNEYKNFDDRFGQIVIYLKQTKKI